MAEPAAAAPSEAEAAEPEAAAEADDGTPADETPQAGTPLPAASPANESREDAPREPSAHADAPAAETCTAEASTAGGAPAAADGPAPLEHHSSVRSLVKSALVLRGADELAHQLDEPEMNVRRGTLSASDAASRIARAYHNARCRRRQRDQLQRLKAREIECQAHATYLPPPPPPAPPARLHTASTRPRNMSGANLSAQKRQRAASARMRPSVVAARQIFPEAVGEESSAKHRAAASAVSRAALSAQVAVLATGASAAIVLPRVPTVLSQHAPPPTPATSTPLPPTRTPCASRGGEAHHARPATVPHCTDLRRGGGWGGAIPFRRSPCSRAVGATRSKLCRCPTTCSTWLSDLGRGFTIEGVAWIAGTVAARMVGYAFLTASL